MSRSRKDDSRYQAPSGPGLQSSPSRDPHSGGAGTFHSAVVSGHNYMRSKAKDRDRSGYSTKDRAKTTNSADATDRYFASAKQVNFHSPPPNTYPCADGAVSARELSWADEVELSMSNNSSHRIDANANTGGTNPKMTKSLDQGQMMKGMQQEVGESKSAMQSSSVNQRPADEKVTRMQQKNTVAQPVAAVINGKAKTNLEKEHETASFKRANCPQLKRGSRKKTLSLNPEEREALESLIEEVLMDGVIDSESASSEEEAEQSETWNSANAEQSGPGANVGAGGEGMQKARGDKGKMGRKYYPGQLKVALKHMTELPPRFSRKLKKAEKYLELNTMRIVNSTTGRIEEEDEESLALARDDKRLSLSPRPPERDKEKAKSKEHQVKEFKRSIRTLLTDLDQYVDETSVLSNSSSATSIHPPGAIICEDLERESLNIRQPPQQSSDLPHEVPSTVQNLLLAAKGFASMAGNQVGAMQEHFQESYQESELVSSGPNVSGYSGAELASQRYASPYTVPDSSAGSQFMVNVPEFVPKGMIMTGFQPQEMLSPAEQHHQYQAPLMPQSSPGSASGDANGHGSRHGGMTMEQMMAVGQGCLLMNASTAMAEPLSSSMMDFSGGLVSMPPSLGAQACSSMGEKMLSPMPPVYVSSGMPLSNLPSPGSLPFYQFQSQNPPPPSSSYSFPVQVPYSSNQYCYMPPALPLQSLPPPYYPRDQVQYADTGMQFKTLVPDWGYQKPKHYSNNASTLPTYSAYSNQAPPTYPGSEQGVPGGMNHLNFRQRKKQPGSSLSPRNMVSSSTNLSGGKLAMQRTRGGEGPSALNRIGLRPGQENVDSYPHPEVGMTASAYGDASLKRFPLTVRSRVSGDGQLGYPGRRENRNFVSDKYAIPRALTSDGKKETRHVTLKPKQPKPNRSLTRSRNDPNVAQLHPLKAHHPSDLSEEGLESPDNFGDVESGADDWSTDNYDLEVSKKGKEEAVENKIDLKDLHNAVEENVTSVVLSRAAEEILVMQDAEMTAVGASIFENQPSDSSQRVVENFGAEVFSQVDSMVPEFILEPAASEPVSETCSTSEVVQHLSLEVLESEERPCIVHVTEDSQLQLEVDRCVLNTENLKRTAVCKKIRASLADLEVGADARPNLSSGSTAEQNAERVGPSVGDHSVNHVCLSPGEISVFTCTDGIAGQAELPGGSSADIDVSDEEIDAEDVQGNESKGMVVMLGSNFMSRLMNMFDPSQSTDSLCKRSSKTVHLSQAVLNQIFLEYVNEYQNSDDLANAASGSLEEDVSNGHLVNNVPCENLPVSVSPSFDERTLTAVTGCITHQQQQLCDSPCDRDLYSCDDCRSEEVVENGVSSPSTDGP